MADFAPSTPFETLHLAVNGIELPSAGTWAIDVSHSSVNFKVKHLGLAKTRGRFTEFEGTVEIGEDPRDTTVAVTIGSPFGARWGKRHEGIDLPAPVGTPVFAAADGRVAYAGNGIRGYGNLVVVRHAGDLLTVYAHNSVLLVAPGQPVRAGDRIALVGQSGHATGPHLHFEVRAGQIPRNPMGFLPRLAKGPS